MNREIKKNQTNQELINDLIARYRQLDQNRKSISDNANKQIKETTEEMLRIEGEVRFISQLVKKEQDAKKEQQREVIKKEAKEVKDKEKKEDKKAKKLNKNHKKTK